MAKDAKEQEIITPKEAKEKVAAAKERTAGKTTNKPVQAGVKAKATFEEPKAKLTKEEKAVVKAEKAKEKAVLKLKKEKQELADAEAKGKSKEIEKRKKAVANAQKKLDDAEKNLQEAIEKDKSKKEQKKDKSLKKSRKQKKSLGDIGREAKKNREEREKLGMNGKKNGKDQDKGKDNLQKQNSNAKLASHIELPSGMRIRQDGPDYVLVTTDKAGNEHTTPVTDVINQIDKYNKGVDAQNAAAKSQSAVKPGQLQNDSIPTSRNPGNVPEKGITPTPIRTPASMPSPTPVLPAVSDNELKGAENIAAKSGKIEPEDVQEFAKTAMQLSKSGLLKDPHALEELNKRKKKQEEEEEARRRRQQEQGGR